MIDLDLARQHLLLGLGIEPDMRRGQTRHERCVKQLADAFAREAASLQIAENPVFCCRTISSSKRSGVPIPMKPPTITLAPAGIIATASSTATAFMGGTPVGHEPHWRERPPSTLDLRQGSPSFANDDAGATRRARAVDAPVRRGGGAAELSQFGNNVVRIHQYPPIADPFSAPPLPE
ncbi:hypothetical protein GGD66_000770 [Bradyrhizobium sp. CIR48]|nr:hypothetical protein [Bradyrhizobium sp. CIR48]